MADITIKQGTDYPFVLIYKDATKTPIDITGASARIMVRKTLYSTAIIDLLATIDGPNGKMTFNFIPSHTDSLLNNESEIRYIFDGILTLLDGTVVPLPEGKFIVKQRITRV